MRWSSRRAISSVFHVSRKICHVPRAKAVTGMRARMMRPGPWRLPLRTSCGGLSTIDVKFGSSAGLE
jgi:hypothetical protein